MARNTYDAWIPEEFTSEVIQRVNQVSAVEGLSPSLIMTSDSMSVPRSAGLDVEVIDKGGTYGEDTSENDDITLTAKKFGKAIRIADEDLDDSLANIISTKQRDWATSYGKVLDNSTLAVTAAPGTGVPFTSLYKLVRTTDSDLSYTADDNYTASGSGGVTYAGLSQALSLVETGDYFDLMAMYVIAHPSFRGEFREIVDTQERPIFIQGTAGTPDTLFGLPVAWSLGAKTSAAATPTPSGNPLLVYCNRDYLRLGRRSGPESRFIDADGVGALTDEAILKLRSRRGFAGGHPKAFAVFEKTA